MIKQSAEKKKNGRPSGFDKLNLDHVKFLAEKGCTDKEMSDFFKIDKATWSNWKNEHPEFFASLKDWKVKADILVEKSLYQRAIGYSHPEEKIFCHEGEIIRAETIKHYPPSEVACIFWLKNRQPDKWREKREDPEDEDLKDSELAFNFLRKNLEKQPRYSKYINN